MRNFIEILPEPTDPQEMEDQRRLRELVERFRAGVRDEPGEQQELHNSPVEMLPDWFPPENRLLEIEKTTGRRVIGLGSWWAEADGHLCPNLATPIFEKNSLA